MKTDITIHVEVTLPHLGIKIYPGSVDGFDLPLPIYIKILSALNDVQQRINAPQEVQAPPPAPEDAKQEPSVSPPQSPKTVVSTKMRKAYTEEEKNEIAQLYRDGHSVKEIAVRFHKTPASIYKLVNTMGVKREAPKAPAARQPKQKKESALEKPWYLKK